MSSQLTSASQAADGGTGRDDWRVIVAIFWITSMIEGLGVSQVFAFLPSYLREMGVPEGDRLPFVGLFGSLIFVVGAPFVPLWGVWADKYSRKAVIVRSALVEAVVFACVALSREPWQLALSILLIGLQLGNTGVMLAGIRDVVPRHRLGTIIGIFGASGPIGFAVGPALGGFLIDALGFSISGMFWVSCVLSVLTAALVWFLSREVRPEVVPVGRVLDLAYGAVRGVLADPAVRRIFAIYGVAFLANQMSRPYQPVVVEELFGTGPGLASAIGFVVGTAALAGAVTSPLGGTARRPVRVPAGPDRVARRRRRGPARGDGRAGPRGPGPRVPRVRRVQRHGRGDGLQPARDRGPGGASVGDAQPRLPAAVRGRDRRARPWARGSRPLPASTARSGSAPPCSSPAPWWSRSGSGRGLTRLRPVAAVPPAAE